MRGEVRHECATAHPEQPGETCAASAQVCTDHRARRVEQERRRGCCSKKKGEPRPQHRDRLMRYAVPGAITVRSWFKRETKSADHDTSADRALHARVEPAPSAQPSRKNSPAACAGPVGSLARRRADERLRISRAVRSGARRAGSAACAVNLPKIVHDSACRRRPVAIERPTAWIPGSRRGVGVCADAGAMLKTRRRNGWRSSQTITDGS